MRVSREQLFINIVNNVKERSVCKRRKVGAIIVMKDRPISMGYNGPPSGFDHCTVCEGQGCSIAVHAEINAILFAARVGIAIEGSTLYCNWSPCKDCAKAIINSGIREVIFEEYYRSMEGIDMLKQAGVGVFKFTGDEKESGI